MFVLLVCDDLFYGSKVSGAAGAAGMQVVVDASAKLDRAADDDCLGVILDLNHPGCSPARLAESVRSGLRLLAYGPHVHTELFAAAEQAGLETVTRGQLDRSVVEVLRSFATPSGESNPDD